VSESAALVEDVSEELAAQSNVPASSRAVELTIKGIKGESCVAKIVTALREVEGVVEVESSSAHSEGLLVVAAHPDTLIRDLMEAVRKLELGYRAVPYREASWQWQGPAGSGEGTHRMNYSYAGGTSKGAASRPPILAIHGFGGNCHHWRKLSADLCEQYRVYALDLAGFGASEKPPNLTYSPHLWYQQVADFAREVVKEPCVLVGNSIGSQVAMYVASEQPDLVKGVCLLNCVGGMNQRGLYKDSLQVALMRPVFELLEFLLKKRSIASWLFTRFSSRDRVEQLLKMKGTPYANPDAVHSELVDIFVEPSLDTGAVDVFVGVFTGDPGPRPEAMLEKIDCPVLVAWGEADPWTPLDGAIGRFFQRQAAQRDNLELVALPDTGHSPQDDRPELVAAAMRPWLLQI